MIAEKISSVIRRLCKLEYLVSPEAWKIIILAMNELKDAATSAGDLERGKPLKTGGLTVIDIFAKPDSSGKFQVCPDRMGALLADLAEAMRDIATEASAKDKLTVVSPPECQ